MANTQNTILLRPPFGRKDEAPALAANIKPGMLVEINSAGQLIPHGTVDGFGATKVATEDAMQGKTTADTCAAGDTVPFYHLDGGGKVQFLLKGNANYPAGTKLASAGDGTLQASGAGTKQIFAVVARGHGINLTGQPNTLVPCDVV